MISPCSLCSECTRIRSASHTSDQPPLILMPKHVLQRIQHILMFLLTRHLQKPILHDASEVEGVGDERRVGAVVDYFSVAEEVGGKFVDAR